MILLQPLLQSVSRDEVTREFVTTGNESGNHILLKNTYRHDMPPRRFLQCLICRRSTVSENNDVSVKRGIRVVGGSMVARVKRATGMRGMSEFAALHGAVEVATVAPAHRANPCMSPLLQVSLTHEDTRDASHFVERMCKRKPAQVPVGSANALQITRLP